MVLVLSTRGQANQSQSIFHGDIYDLLSQMMHKAQSELKIYIYPVPDIAVRSDIPPERIFTGHFFGEFQIPSIIQILWKPFQSKKCRMDDYIHSGGASRSHGTYTNSEGLMNPRVFGDC